MFGGAYPTPHGEDGRNSLFYLGLETKKYVALDAETYALRGTAKDPYDHKNTFAISITDNNEKSKTFVNHPITAFYGSNVSTGKTQLHT